MKKNYTEIDVIRSKCLNDFSFFVRYFFKKLNNKKFNVGEHHEELFYHAKRIVDGEVTKIMFNVAPRYGKTEVMVKMFIAYSLALNPASRFIHLSYSDSLALDNSSAVKDLITSAEYQELFPYVQISKDSRAKEKWYTTAGGGVLARSSSGQVTGFGAGQTNFDNEIQEFGGAIIIDDPIKPDDANSEILRERVNNKFNTTIRNRVNSETTPIIIIMQRLHPEDLCGYLLENEPEDWEVVRMPVIKEDGTALWTEKHDIATLEKMKEQLGVIFETQYMQNPRPKEGMLYLENDVKYYTELPKEVPIAKYGFVDIADEGMDFHSVPIGYVYSDGSVYIEDVLFTQLPASENVSMTADIINKHKLDGCRVESNFGGTLYINSLKPLVEDTRLLPTKAVSAKHGRILNDEMFVKKHVYFKIKALQSNDYKAFMKNVFEYQRDGKAKHDDALDSLEGLNQLIKSTNRHLYE